MNGTNTAYASYIKEQLSLDQIGTLVLYEKESGNELNLDHREVLFSQLLPMLSIDDRINAEIPFMLTQLEKHAIDIKSARIFDSCLGSGATSLGLLHYGAHPKLMVANEIDSDWREYALSQFREKSLTVDNLGLMDSFVTFADLDWRKLWRDDALWDMLPYVELSLPYAERKTTPFDLVTNTGNNLTYLFKEQDRQDSVDGFYNILKDDGLLIIDQRNYDAIIEGRLINKGLGPYTGKEKIIMTPRIAKKDMVVLNSRAPSSKDSIDFVLYPLKQGEMESHLTNAGFKDIEVFSDYRAGYDKNAEFFTYVAKK